MRIALQDGLKEFEPTLNPKLSHAVSVCVDEENLQFLTGTHCYGASALYRERLSESISLKQALAKALGLLNV